jgi:pantoate kinase
MRIKKAYEIEPGDFVANYPGGIVAEVKFAGPDSEMVKFTFTEGHSMLTWDDSMIKIFTDSDD